MSSRNAFKNYDLDKNLVENEKKCNLRRSVSLILQPKEDYHTENLKKLEKMIEIL